MQPRPQPILLRGQSRQGRPHISAADAFQPVVQPTAVEGVNVKAAVPQTAAPVNAGVKGPQLSPGLQLAAAKLVALAQPQVPKSNQQVVAKGAKAESGETVTMTNQFKTANIRRQQISNGGQQIATGGQKVAAGWQQNIHGGQQVAAVGQQIAIGGKQNIPGGHNISAGGQQVVGGGQNTSAGGQQLAANGQKKAAGGQKIGGQQVTTGIQQIAAGWQQNIPGGHQVLPGGQQIGTPSSNMISKSNAYSVITNPSNVALVGHSQQTVIPSSPGTNTANLF